MGVRTTESSRVRTAMVVPWVSTNSTSDAFSSAYLWTTVPTSPATKPCSTMDSLRTTRSNSVISTQSSLISLDTLSPNAADRMRRAGGRGRPGPADSQRTAAARRGRFRTARERPAGSRPRRSRAPARRRRWATSRNRFLAGAGKPPPKKTELPPTTSFGESGSASLAPYWRTDTGEADWYRFSIRIRRWLQSSSSRRGQPPRSTRRVFSPARTRRQAAQAPPNPEPTMTASYFTEQPPPWNQAETGGDYKARTSTT